MIDFTALRFWWHVYL